MTERSYRAARRAVSTVFFINGAIIASWALHIPAVQEKLSLSAGVLGLALLGVALGGLIMMPVTGALIARWSSRWVTSVSSLGLCIALSLLLFAPKLALLVAGLIFFGLTNGAMDVAMNAQAVAVEERYRRPIMSSFHGLFSVGALVGAAVGGVVLGRGVTPEAHVVAVSGLFILVTLAVLRYLLPADVDVQGDAPVFALPKGPLIGLGAVAFFVMFSEGAMVDWSAVYLRQSLGTGPGEAAAGFAAFSLMMAIGRLLGDGLVRRLGRVRLVQASALLATLGLGSALWMGDFWAAIVGFACAGLGYANVVPIVFSASGTQPGIPAGTGIAAAATTGYLGFLVGPPLIGLTAEATNLPLALGLVVLFSALIIVLAPRVLRTPVPK